MTQPIKRKSLAEAVADRLQHSIERGVYPLQSKLPAEPELMQQFEVGRSTIREAIKFLTQQGFVSVQQGLGTFVISYVGSNDLDAKIERADFADVFEVRQLLEIKIVEKAAHNRKNIHIEKMTGKLKERKKSGAAGLLKECIAADIAFHTLLAESSGNSILFELYKTLSLHVSKFFEQVYTDTTPFTGSQALHEALLAAVKEKNASKALQLLKKIIGNP
ncbi:FadR/GntR family transcriptional regulator [Niabella beijingensis]|uniref:FadR/GntR family transcriptional regulator n=1 Tax=Niabella beijingensis TaxID=2872700 RepID=UPI001CBFCA1C|nr:FCD domain-containing protein [Niabella beijingensis]MBZ4192255.1 GntR family transcriptional regulator [Niabella beijingensis]